MADDQVNYSQVLHEKLNAVADFRGKVFMESKTLKALSNELAALCEVCERKMHFDTMDRVRRVIEKLEADEEIGYLEMDLIRTWIVGDASLQLEMETNHITWVAELKHVLDKFAGAELGGVGLQEILKIEARAKAASYLVNDILKYIERKEKSQHFEESAGAWSKETKLEFARTLQAELDKYEPTKEEATAE